VGKVFVKILQVHLRALQTFLQICHTIARRLPEYITFSRFKPRVHTFILSVLFHLITSKGSCVETAGAPYLPRITKINLLIPSGVGRQFWRCSKQPFG